MSEHRFSRVVLICDAACNIRLAVADAASLAARWGAALHGVYLDDENLHRFAALPFGQQVSLSSPDIAEDLTAAAMARLSSALGAGMKRTLAEAAAAHGLQWTFRAIRDLPSAAPVPAEDGDILVVEAAARAFSGAWRPRAAWDKNPIAFTGTVLIRGRSTDAKGILVLLPEDHATRGKVLSASAALARGDEEIILAGKPAIPADFQYFRPEQRKHIRILPLRQDRSCSSQLQARRNLALIVLHADDAGSLGQTGADILLVR